MHIGRVLLALGALAVTGWAQPSAGVTGPVTGFIFSPTPSGSIRPMLGIPGAAYLGNAVATGLEAASVAPDGSAALGVQQGGRLMLYSGLRSAPVATALAVTGGIAIADHFAWAPDSASAAVYSSSSGQAQILSNMDSTPTGASPIDLLQLPGPVTAMAFDGQHLILAVASADAGGVYLAGGSASVQRIASAASPSAIALAGSSLYFADNQSQQIFQVQNYAGTPAVVSFANDASISSPVGVQVSADGQRLYVANAGNQKLVVYDIASRSPAQTISLNFTPSRLDRFGDGAVFLMNSGGQGPLYVVRDGAAGKAVVYFVPSPNRTHPARAPIRPV